MLIKRFLPICLQWYNIYGNSFKIFYKNELLLDLESAALKIIYRSDRRMDTDRKKTLTSAAAAEWCWNQDVWRNNWISVLPKITMQRRKILFVQSALSPLKYFWDSSIIPFISWFIWISPSLQRISHFSGIKRQEFTLLNIYSASFGLILSL